MKYCFQRHYSISSIPRFSLSPTPTFAIYSSARVFSMRNFSSSYLHSLMSLRIITLVPFAVPGLQKLFIQFAAQHPCIVINFSRQILVQVIKCEIKNCNRFLFEYDFKLEDVDYSIKRIVREMIFFLGR